MHSIRTDGAKGEKGANARARIGGRYPSKTEDHVLISLVPVVVQQEMLHLALAGNVFTSLDSASDDGHLGPRLYSQAFLAQYGHDEVLWFGIPLKLEQCNKRSLERFMKVNSLLSIQRLDFILTGRLSARIPIRRTT